MIEEHCKNEETHKVQTRTEELAKHALVQCSNGSMAMWTSVMGDFAKHVQAQSSDGSKAKTCTKEHCEKEDHCMIEEHGKNEETHTVQAPSEKLAKHALVQCSDGCKAKGITEIGDLAKHVPAQRWEQHEHW